MSKQRRVRTGYYIQNLKCLQKSCDIVKFKIIIVVLLELCYCLLEKIKSNFDPEFVRAQEMVLVIN